MIRVTKRRAPEADNSEGYIVSRRKELLPNINRHSQQRLMMMMMTMMMMMLHILNH